MTNYPFVKCLHPNRIVNPYTNEVVVVPCGKCEVCAQTKGGINTLKCELESLSHKYCMFVTLTYSNDNIPLASFERNVNSIPNFNEFDLDKLPFKPSCDLMYRVDSKTSHGYWMYNVTERLGKGEILGFYNPKSLSSLAELKRKFNVNGFIPYLSKRDLQLFLKRLRKRTDEKIRYYAVGEYGPVHFRPHFHILLWFDKTETYEKMFENIRASWTYGRIDASLSNGKCSSYVASYVNSNCYLPEILKFNKTRVFNTHSYFLGEKYLQTSRKEAYESDYKGFVQRSISINGSYTDVTLWRTLKVVYFPKCKGYMQKSNLERDYTYRLYEGVREWTREISPFKQARYIASYIKEFGFTHKFSYVDRLLKYFFYSLQIKAYELHSCLKDDWLVRSIYMELRLSKHYLEFVLPYFGDTFKAIGRINQFYKDQDYDNLVNWYQLMSEYFMEGWEMDSLNLFYDNFEQEDLENNPVYMNFRSSRLGTFQNSIKHKKLNDMNKIFENI